MFNKLKILKMKKIKFFLVALFAVMGVSNAFSQTKPLQDDEWNDDNFFYKVIYDGDVATKTAKVKITKTNGSVIGELGSDKLKGTFTKKYGDDTWTIVVTQISNGVFKDQVKLTKVTFPKEIEWIGADAFNGCTLLSEIVFETGSKLSLIGDRAFATTQIVNPDFTPCNLLATLPNLLFVESDAKENSYVKTVKLPETAVFTDFGTALFHLPNLESTNIDKTKVQYVRANAFNGDAKLTAMELPNTVKQVEASAFAGSAIANLTINVDAIQNPGIGDGTNNIYGTDVAVLTTLTLKGTLKGHIKTNAFKGCGELATLTMSDMTFGTKGQIEASAFENCVKLESVAIGNIENNDGTYYTIAKDAFKGCEALVSVTIDDITCPNAVAEAAFGNQLMTVEIGNIYTKGEALQAGAFVFATGTGDQSVTIGNVRAQDAATPVMGAGAFDLNGTGNIAVTIGAVEAKGNNFSANSFDGKVTSLTFTGDIEENGIDKKIINDLTGMTAITFKGKVGTGGIYTSVFGGMPKAKKAVITFEEELAPGAVMSKAFMLDGAPTTETVLTVKYLSATHANPTVAGMPFAQDAFWTTYTGDRDVKIEIKNAALNETFRAGQNNTSTDIIYRAEMAPPAPDVINVYQKGSENNAFGRFVFEKGKIYKIERRPQDANITYTLYTTYVEEDEYEADATGKTGLTTINMLPMVSVDGYYYIDLSAAANDLVVIIKANGSGVTKDLEMEYEKVGGVPTVNAVQYTDNRVKVAKQVVTNQQLRDGTGSTGIDVLTTAVLEANDLYAIINPANHNGIRANILDYKGSTKPFVNTGMFYVLAKKYDTIKAGRLTINWIDESNATAIAAAKTTVKSDDNAIYTLQGVRVNSVKKGQLYIKNGKKYIAK
jgi:hypothetical protein